MSDFVSVARAEDIPPGTAAVVEVEGVEIAVCNAGGDFYAMQNDCPHAGGPLGEGEMIDDYLLECPLHGSVFDVRTGEPEEGPTEEALEQYEVVVEDGIVKVSVP